MFGGWPSREVSVTRTQACPNAAALLSRAAMRGEPPTALVAALDPDELRTALNAVLGVVGEFVRHIADYNVVSERAVLRSMGVEPDEGVDELTHPKRSNLTRVPQSSSARATHRRF